MFNIQFTYYINKICINSNRMQMINKLKSKFLNKWESFLINQKFPPPFIIFMVFLYYHSGIQIISVNHSNIFLIIGLALALLCNFNFLFLMTSFFDFYSGPLSTCIMVLVCIIFCNQKWKICIFIFNLLDSLTAASEVNDGILILGASFLCLYSYHHFIFENIRDNILYFSGYFAISIYYLIKMLLIRAGVETNTWIMFLLALAGALLGRFIIKTKIKKISTLSTEQIKSTRVMAFYLSQLQNQINDKWIFMAKVKLHKDKCRVYSCFCQSQNNYQPSLFLRQVFIDSFAQFQNIQQPKLLQLMIIFLINHQQVISALSLLNKRVESDYFMISAKIKCLGIIKRHLMNSTSINIYQKQYLYALQYDSFCLRMTVDIDSIIHSKLQFWKQVIQPSPVLTTLQLQGNQIIDKMSQLNLFYNNSIKNYEGAIYSLDTTILYGMFLLSATNFIEYAEFIIKKTSKLLQDIEVGENMITSIYSIKAIVQQDSKYFQELNKNNYEFTNYNFKNSCKLIIQSLSAGFCMEIGYLKKDLVGKELNTIIPDGYKTIHNIRLKNVLNFNSSISEEIGQSKILNKSLKLPVLGANHMLYIAQICIKLISDVRYGFSFMATLKKVNDRSSTLLMNFEEKVTQKQQKFNIQVIHHSEVAKYIGIIKQSWHKLRIMQEQTLSIIISTINYSITLSSPLLMLFLCKQQMKDSPPPIHITIVNEQRSNNKKQQKKIKNNMALQLSQIQKGRKHDSDSVSNSFNGTQAITILANFVQNNKMSIYRNIQLVFILVVLCCLCTNIGGNYSSDLEWDNRKSQYNPIYDIVDTLKINLIITKTLLNIGDLVSYKTNYNQFNFTKITSYSSTQDYFHDIKILLIDNYNDLKQIFKNKYSFPSNLLQPQIDNLWFTSVTLTDPTIIISPIQFQTMQMTFNQLLQNYAVDLNLMLSNQIKGILLYDTYNAEIAALLNTTGLSMFIDKSIDRSQNLDIILSTSLSAVLVLLVLPLGLVLRARRQKHEKIFDLIVSIDVKEIVKEMDSLNCIKNILKNYKQTNKVLKMNVRSYRQNSICTNKYVSNKSTINNDMIIGLQKYDRQKVSIFQEQKPNNKANAYGKTLNDSVLSSFRMMNSSMTGSHNFTESNLEKSTIFRKRAGELNLHGSEYDSNKKIIFKHCLLYLIIILFISFMAMLSQSNQNYYEAIRVRKQTIVKILDQRISDSITFLIGKIYIRNGFCGIKTQYSPEMAAEALKSKMKSVPIYNYDIKDNSETIENNCTLILADKSSFIAQTFCAYDYSSRILNGQFFTLQKGLYQTKFNMDLDAVDKWSGDFNRTLVQLSQKIFYMQSLNNKLQQNLLAMLNLLLSDISTISTSYNGQKALILYLVLIWFVVGGGVGLYIILRMRRQYFREVYMITFLNNEMVYNNKRVESFLQSLAKNVQN